MSHARSGTERRERKENPVTAFWSNRVCSHQEFAGTSWRKWGRWEATIQAVGLDLSPCRCDASWHRGRQPWSRHRHRTGAHSSASPHPREPPAVGEWASPSEWPCRLASGALSSFFFSDTDNSGNKIPSPANGPIQLQIPLCLCQQRTPNAELERVAASKPLLPFPLNSPSDSSFRMKLLALSLSPKGLFRSCWIFLTKLIWLFLPYTRGEIFFKRRLNIF